MKNIIGGMPQDYGLNKPEEEKKEKPELEAIPIFRNNDLYAEIFPEIKPAFEKGEEPTIKKIFETVLQYKNKKIIFDNTCKGKIAHPKLAETTLDDFPEELGLMELPLHPLNAKLVDMNSVYKLFEEKLNISFLRGDGFLKTIEEKVEKIIGNTFSPELVRVLLEIAKEKNKDIKDVYILTENINDHVYDKDMREAAISILAEEAKKSFNMDPILLDSMGEDDVKGGDHIIVDRHNKLLRGNVVGERPTQFSVLPLETELSNNERYLENKTENGKLIGILRKEFEKEKEDNREN